MSKREMAREIFRLQKELQETRNYLIETREALLQHLEIHHGI